MKQKSSKPEKTSASALPLAMSLILPVVTLLLCAAIVLVCSLRPYEKLHTYLQIAFMDDLKQAPSSSSDGLEIVQNDITTNYSGKIAKTGEPVYPAFGEQYGVLSCEAIDLYVPVYWGATSELLELGACQTTASAIAGAGGNAVISAHVNTFFNRLDELQTGDTLTLYTNYGRFTYAVQKSIQFENTDKQYILPTDKEQLTLYTCEMQVFGSSTKRIGVVCDCISTEFYETEAAQ